MANTAQTGSPLINLFNLSWTELREWVAQLGEPAYRADQLVKWLHQRSVVDFNEMTNLSKRFREQLNEFATLQLPSFEKEVLSSDGTRKWLYRLDDQQMVETVFIPERDRGTLCISSQVGCGLNCSFCATGKEGFNRNLSLAEMMGQLWLANERLTELGLKKVTNVVMMGMGEPLLNYDTVVAAIEYMLSDQAYGLSKYRVTVSTSGLVPQMQKLRAATDAALAVSLHAPNDELRNQLVPLNKKYPLAVLMDCIKHYYSGSPNRSVTLEYVMLSGVNDSKKHAKQLITLLEGVSCKVNLIPFNPFPGSSYESTPMDEIQAFSDRLRASGLISTIRKTRGSDTESACGMLVGNFTDRTQRRERWQRTGKLIPIPVVQESV
jgi:23S rRNA (adenine2503-C2)-methyltransferase